MRAEDRLEDHLSPPHWFLYSLNTPCSDLTKLNINIPDLLKVALTDTKRSLPDHIQKKMFIQGESVSKELKNHWTRQLTMRVPVGDLKLEILSPRLVLKISSSVLSFPGPKCLTMI